MAENIAIIGSGPAGLTAGIYAARANLKPLLFEGYGIGGSPGGQLMDATIVENFPGFSEGIGGPRLMLQMRKQALLQGARIFSEDIAKIHFDQRPFKLVSDTEMTVEAQAVIIATGSSARRLPLPSEQRFFGKGISVCAVCDGALPIFRDKTNCGYRRR